MGIEHLTLPRSLEHEWSVRGYYGTLSHNAKSIYQRYIGWYDANPAHLNPLPPTLDEAIDSGAIALEGDAGKLRELFELIDDFIFLFNILEPQRQSPLP